jgi:hypothetical protein
MQVPNASANQVPIFTKDGKRGIRVTEREFLGDVMSGPVLVSGSTAFYNSSYRINPSDPVTFPWLSRVAANYDQWEPNGIVFEFISTSSEFNGTSQALGTVILATEYDPSDPAYTNKVEMENADYANSTKPSLTALHGLECDPSDRPTAVLYTGTFPVGEQKFYDLGSFQLATQGMSAINQTLGELWISYDISFYKKQISSASLIIPTWIYKSTTNSGTMAIVGAGTVTPGSDPRISLIDWLLPGTQNVLRFDPQRVSGRYLVTVTCSGTSGVGPSAPPAIANVFGAATGCTLTSSRFIKDTGASGGFMCEAVFTVNSVNAQVLIQVYASALSAIYNNTTTVVTELRSNLDSFNL